MKVHAKLSDSRFPAFHSLSKLNHHLPKFTLRKCNDDTATTNSAECSDEICEEIFKRAKQPNLHGDERKIPSEAEENVVKGMKSF